MQLSSITRSEAVLRAGPSCGASLSPGCCFYIRLQRQSPANGSAPLSSGMLLVDQVIFEDIHFFSTCELIERPSKKDGFCFKLFHSMDQSVWASRGPEGETIGAVVQPLPTSHLIFRAPTNAAGKCWMDALELALRSGIDILLKIGAFR